MILCLQRWKNLDWYTLSGNCVSDFRPLHLLPITFQEQGEVQPMEQKKELMIFRVAQELLNNAVKHSQANTIHVIIRGTDKLEIIVEDDGVGFDPQAQRTVTESGKGLGLFNIENRVRLLGANLEFETQRKRGSKVTMRMPQ